MPSLDNIGLGTRPTERNGRVYRENVNGIVTQVVLQVDREMRGQPAHMVYELLSLHLERRLPGISVDDDVLRTAAARIAVGLTPI